MLMRCPEKGYRHARRNQYGCRGRIRAYSTEMKALSLNDNDRPAKEGGVAVEVSVSLCREDFLFRNICAEIADFVFVQLILLARSSMFRFPAPLPILACLALSFLLRL